MKQQTARQHWLSVLAHSEASALASHWQSRTATPAFERLRPAETGLTRSGAHGRQRETLRHGRCHRHPRGDQTARRHAGF